MPKGNHRIDPVLQRRAEFLQPVDRLGRVETFSDIGELVEQHLFRRNCPDRCPQTFAGYRTHLPNWMAACAWSILPRIAFDFAGSGTFLQQ